MITNRLGSFALIGIKDLVAKDRTTKKVEANLKHLVNINITDELSTDYLRGGYTNPKLLTIYGDRDTTLTATSATMSTDLLKILSSTEAQIKTKSELMIEDLEADGSAVPFADGEEGKSVFTLSADVTPNSTMTIFAIDQFGKEVKPALVLGQPAEDGDIIVHPPVDGGDNGDDGLGGGSTGGSDGDNNLGGDSDNGDNAVDGVAVQDIIYETGFEYSIDGRTITCNASITKIRVYYESLVEVETLEIADIVPKSFAFSGLAVAKEIESQKLYKVWIEIPNGSISPSYNISAKNEASAPDSIELTIECLQDTTKGYPIAISFLEEE